MPENNDMTRYTPPKNLKRYGIAALCVAGAIVVVGIVGRVVADQNVAQWTAAEAIPTVKVISPAGDKDNRTLVLPGDVQAFYNAPIYARVSGYLKRWYVDIGTPVKSGQLLAVIDIPDQDQQLAQAKADLGTAVANQKLSASTAKRWNELLAENAVSRQEVDEKNGDLAAKNAAVASARANVDRLAALETLKRIVAPFDGTVTSRATDIGALVNLGSASEPPLFTVADQSRLRIYVQVPQSYTGDIKTGMAATFTVPEYPGRIFTAAIAATSGAINTQTGSSQVQLQTANADHTLKPGDYAQVHFNLPSHAGAIRVPSSALILRDTGMAVATVVNGHVLIKPIVIGADFGDYVEVTYGLSSRDRVIDNPPDSLDVGQAVKIARAE
ncbi:MAG TPA: efflux RND transporter periplasmic adaptor subunit [Rhizomicrobium sp.]|jgi:RND family efflux transporter MFP subunit